MNEGQLIKDFYRTEKIYSDEKFKQIMDSIGWHMPFNLSAYHFMSHNPPVCTNPVMNALPIIHCQVDKLLSTQISVSATMRDKKLKSNHEIFRKWEKFVIVRDELSNGVCGKLHRLDEEHTVVSKLLPLPITLKYAKEYVDKHHRHNTAPRGHKLSLGLMSPIDEEVIGVVIASVPKSRIQAQDPYMLEINRCCSNAYYENVCSKLYSLAIKAGKSSYSSQPNWPRTVTHPAHEKSPAARGWMHNSVRLLARMPCSKVHGPVNSNPKIS